MTEVVISPNDKLGLACSYAALILHDGKKQVDAKSLQSISKAAGIEVDHFWAGVFENVLKGFDLETLLENSLGGGGGGSNAPVQSGTGPQTTTTEKKEEVKEEPKKVEKEEESGEIGGLFGDEE